jgi:endonuclease/exonuclease/phosphatase family metal-dependent hydrolase
VNAEGDEMVIRIATLNLEQDHKRWPARRDLVVTQLGEVNPDILALNELHLRSQSGRWLQRAANSKSDSRYNLLQQSKTGEESRIQGEGLLTRYPIIESANLDYHSHDCVALVARFEIENKLVDVYVTHLIAAKVDDSARQYQVTQLLQWIGSRDDADGSIVCGDFNAAPDQPSIGLMTKLHRFTQSAATAFSPLREPGGEPTHPEWPRFDRCIDYIWISQSIEVKASGLCFNRPADDDPDLWPSDHVGVWADLAIG